MGVQGARPPAGARGILSGGQVIGAPASFPFPKRCVDSALGLLTIEHGTIQAEVIPLEWEGATG
jgi:hypothetical protein